MQDVVIVGAGSRGLTVYADYIQRHPEKFRLVGVAEPREYYRQEAASRHNLSPEQCFLDWRELLQRPALGAGLILATQDRDHFEPALALMEHGYDLLLEKPMAPTLSQCELIQQTSRRFQKLLVVAHVLRYTPYFKQLKALVQCGAIGQLVTARHFEPVLYWHQAHSFVRGNWRNTGESAPMILAKSCHDLDMLCYLVDDQPKRVVSFGRVSHFCAEQRPAGAQDRCLDCPLSERDCPYSAERFYLGLQQAGQLGWPLDTITSDTSREGVLRALREGPYGRCVYACDNDVVDHQVVAVEFAGGATATFTMTAFAHERLRETELLGSHAQLSGDGRRIWLRPFGQLPSGLPDQNFETQPNGDMLWDFSHIPSGGHSGGDDGLMEFFHWCLENRQQALKLPLPEEALRGHALCFGAEESRLQQRVVAQP
ncbi:Gfo/Idh/MocA family oxidoreductase [bacterium]|nr:Gfo/Idh/MocA family oxidoreductase [bacterium]